jgi:hypothetical protein
MHGSETKEKILEIGKWKLEDSSVNSSRLPKKTKVSIHVERLLKNFKGLAKKSKETRSKLFEISRLLSLPRPIQPYYFWANEIW